MVRSTDNLRPSPAVVDLRAKEEKLTTEAKKIDTQGGVEIVVRDIFDAVVKLAKDNNDPSLVTDLKKAISFDSRLGDILTGKAKWHGSSKDQRLHARLQQLSRVFEQGTDYASVRAMVTSLKNVDLKQLAQDVDLLGQAVVDVGGQTEINSGQVTLREWYVNKALLLKAYATATDDQTKRALGGAVLHYLAKHAAPPSEMRPKLGVQATPMQKTDGYHRGYGSSNNLIHAYTYSLCREGRGDSTLKPEDLLLANGSGFETTLRESTFYKQIKDEGAFARELKGQTSFHLAKLLDPNDHTLLFFDIGPLVAKKGGKPLEHVESTTAELRKQISGVIDKVLEQNPKHDGKPVTREQLQTALEAKLILATVTKVHDQVTLAIPGASDGANGKAQLEHLRGLINHGGHTPGPAQIRENWLRFKDITSILTTLSTPSPDVKLVNVSELNVFKSPQEFLQHPVIGKMRALANNDGAQPYQRILAEATLSMLEGLQNLKDGNGRDLHQAFGAKVGDGGDLLQYSYNRVLNFMQDALNGRDDILAFTNDIHLVHEEIFLALTLMEPYSDKDFKSAVGKLTEGMIPKGLTSTVSLKNSGMGCVSDILASVLKQVETSEGGHRGLRVATQKDSYYESNTFAESPIPAMRHAKRSVLDGDSNTLDAKSTDLPLDVFVCEMHHNISMGRTSYAMEDLTAQVDMLFSQKKVSKHFTVAIDCTIDTINSPDIKKFLEHNKQRIDSGELNVVLFRSAQKFDMLGIDNYNGGYTNTINNGKAFAAFTKHIDRPDARVTDMSLQGLTHLNTCAGPVLDEYRKGIIDNNRELYNRLKAKGMEYDPASTHQLQMAKSTDPNIVFLDFKVPLFGKCGDDKLGEEFNHNMQMLVQSRVGPDFPVGARPSFGFQTANFSTIGGGKNRFNVGLEGEETLTTYENFWVETRDKVDRLYAEAVKALGHPPVSPEDFNQVGTYLVQHIQDPA